MKAVTVAALKTELSTRPAKELLEICLRLSKFKKENKELLTYLLFEADQEADYITSVKREVDSQFDAINTRNFFFIKKSLRKILREIKKYVRYSQKKETEVELLLYFCHKLAHFTPSIQRNAQLVNLYNKQLELIENAIEKLHEDLQYDYGQELQQLKRM
jgi:nitrate/TMAO reductase-like tetraheme cytochrome c subunit